MWSRRHAPWSWRRLGSDRLAADPRARGLEAGGEQRADGAEEEPEQHERAYGTDSVNQPALAAEIMSGEEDARHHNGGDEAPEECVGEGHARVAGQTLTLGLLLPLHMLLYGKARIREEL